MVAFKAALIGCIEVWRETLQPLNEHALAHRRDARAHRIAVTIASVKAKNASAGFTSEIRTINSVFTLPRLRKTP
jgi:hypothetical protein